MAESPKTIGPSGGSPDYTTFPGWESGEARNLTTLGEIAVAQFRTFSGGLDEQSPFTSGWTTDAGDYIRLEAAVGHEADFSALKSGFYFTATTNTNVIRPDTAVKKMVIENIEFDMVATSSIPIVDNNGGLSLGLTVTGCIFDSGTGKAIDITTNNPPMSLDRCLFLDQGSDSFIDTTDTTGTVNKCTSIRAGNRGFVTTGSDFTNCVALNATNAEWSDQGGTHSNNAAGPDSTAPGTSSIQALNTDGRDFADYGGDDYRTANDSPKGLDTGGSVDFIGCALEPSAGGVTVPAVDEGMLTGGMMPLGGGLA